VGEDSSILRHLRAGQDQRARISEAVDAFRRLAPEDYGYFLATIDAALGGKLELAGATPLLLAAPANADQPAPEARDAGSLRAAVLGLLADGQPRSTTQIRGDLEATRTVKRASLNTEIFTLRKLGLIRSEGQGRGRRHTLAKASPPRSPSGGTAREPKPRAARRKRDDDDDHPARSRSSPSAEQIYASAISGHDLLTADEELVLARKLEEVEVALWDRLRAGFLAEEARQIFLALEEPADPNSAADARAADLDRLVLSQLLRAGREDRDDVDEKLAKKLADELSALRAMAGEAGRIRGRFAACNLRLVPSVIRRYGYHLGTPLAMSDLIQEGNIGLLKAIPRYDYRRGLRFSTFASWWIRHYLVRARQNMGTEVRVPVHLHDLANKARHAREKLRRQLEREPTGDELARAMKVPRKSIETLQSAWLRHRESIPSFDSVGEDGTTPSYLASDAALADEVISGQQEEARIAELVGRMSPLLAQVLRRRFGLDGREAETLKEIGRSMQLSRERIRQLEQKALAILRAAMAESDSRAA
jgi:RNA polymerase sigma factor (sigma-70 family)